jgi:hypothetical protein
MRWIIVTIVAEVLVALALGLGDSVATASTTCKTAGPQDNGLFPATTIQTCSRQFWWD